MPTRERSLAESRGAPLTLEATEEALAHHVDLIQSNGQWGDTIKRIAIAFFEDIGSVSAAHRQLCALLTANDLEPLPSYSTVGNWIDDSDVDKEVVKKRTAGRIRDLKQDALVHVAESLLTMTEPRDLGKNLEGAAKAIEILSRELAVSDNTKGMAYRKTEEWAVLPVAQPAPIMLPEGDEESD